MITSETLPRKPFDAVLLLQFSMQNAPLGSVVLVDELLASVVQIEFTNAVLKVEIYIKVYCLTRWVQLLKTSVWIFFVKKKVTKNASRTVFNEIFLVLSS